jgi:hypothetical protein
MDMSGDVIAPMMKRGRGIKPLQVDMGNPGLVA